MVSLYVLFFESNCKAKLGIIAIVSLVVTYYIRVGFGRYFTTIDESYYISLIGNPVWYKTSIVSGFVVPFLLHSIRILLGIDPVSLVVYYSLAFAVLYVGIIYWAYTRVGISKKYSTISLAVLFVSSFYIWSFIQIRPQQLGILVGLSIVSLFMSIKPNKMFFIIMPVLFTLLIFTHIFSFFLFSILLMAYFVLVFIKSESSEEVFKKFLGISFAVLIAWLAFLSFPYSSRTIRTLVWLLNSMPQFDNFQLLLNYFSSLSTFAYIMLVFLIYHAGKFLHSRYLNDLVNLWESLRGILIKFSLQIIFLALIFLSVGFYIQFKLGASTYTKIYRGSVLTLVFFQLGNIFFGFMFVRGFLDKLKDNTLTEFDIMAIIWIFIGIAMLFISFFMPKGSAIWGFSNWMVRVAQYFVIFAAPTVTYALYKDIKAMGLSHLKLAISILISVLIVISMINTARPPQIYDYDIVWSDEMIDVAKEVRLSNTLMFRYNVSPYLKFAMENLLKAYGKPVEITQGSSIVLSSDAIYVYGSNYHPLSLGFFSKKRGPVIVILGTSNPKVKQYFTTLLNKEFPALIIGEIDNCEMYIKQGYPLIVMGGKLANKCTQLLEKNRAMLVYMDKDSVVTPYFTYSVPSPKKEWWNVNEGLFVIQAVKYHGAPILIIEGTNIDATVAGVWYFVNKVSQDIEKYKNTYYIVGKWIESDNKVLRFLKFDPNDNNGFSEGDTVEIIEIG
ncbi:hypothetical protein [Thermococcus barophilus]|nr:hypothetical protein [Thermococcus barophilus]